MSLQVSVSLILTAVLVWPALAAPVSNDELRILVLEGDRAVNDVRTRAATAPVIEVRESNGHPVEGAEVTFHLPTSGPGAVFANGGLNQTVRTNHQGQATPTGYMPNGPIGRFTIRITAAWAGRSGEASIVQMNSQQPYEPQSVQRSGGKTKWIVLGIMAAAGTAVAIGLSRGTSGPVPVTLVSGGATVGGPR